METPGHNQMLDAPDSYATTESDGSVGRYGSTHHTKPPQTLPALNRPNERKRQSLPAITATTKPPRPLLRRRSSSRAKREKEKAKPEKLMTKNYPHLVQDFENQKPFAVRPDRSYPPDTMCALCQRRKPTTVFFPCQHKCVCEICILKHGINTNRVSSASGWSACPVCMTDIRLMLPHTGHEEEEYWQWVLEVNPVLPFYFKEEFREAGRHLRKHVASSRATAKRYSTSQQHGLDQANGSTTSGMSPPATGTIVFMSSRLSWLRWWTGTQPPPPTASPPPELPADSNAPTREKSYCEQTCCIL